tara:strand:- start:2606 stop:2992 length:387 start_codon:yes stop_codon:yes gene_type:complete
VLKACILFSAACLFAIGCYVMFKPDLSDLGFIPVVATNAETASEFRSLFAGSFIAYGYLLVRYAFSFNAISIAQTIAYIMSFIAFGRLVSFFYEGLNSFGLFVFFGEVFLVIVLIMAHRKRKNEIPYF